MIEIRNLRKVFDNGFEALKDVDLEIHEGELVCLLGPSGCGKSTILNLIAGLLDPTDGDILFAGNSVAHLPPGERRIGMVFQNYALYPHMTTLENITFPLRVGKYKKSKQEALKIAEEYMELTSISDLRDKKPGAMSGGQQQRVAITRALMQNPQVLLLDEPLSNLDARLRLKIREEIRRLVKQIGITTIFVTHDQEEALSISDRIALMDNGIIKQVDIPQQLYLNPVDLFAAKFIGNPVINIFELKHTEGQLKGQQIQLSVHDFKKEQFKSESLGDKLLLGVRPEHFVQDEGGPIEVRIESVEMIGRYCTLHFELEGQRAQAVIDSRIPVEEGQTLRFSLDMGSIFLFDPDGRRVY